MFVRRICLFSLFIFALIAEASSTDNTPYRLFPTLYRKASQFSLPQTVSKPSFQGGAGTLSDRVPMLANNTVVAFYGHPSSRKMGILGLYSKEELAQRVKTYAGYYDDVNGSDGTVSAYYIIYGTCWPGGEIGYLKDSTLEEYIAYAQSQGMIVFVDHQIGKYTVKESMEKILPFLKYPNVHLAIDPEWRTLIPMKEIGSITAEELNQAQRIMQDYIVANNIPGIRMLVVHQFHEKMILNRDRVKADLDRVLLVHTADGFGSPSLKRSTYSLIAKAENLPVKGFKLFFKSDFPLAGWDNPLLSPAEVMALDPRPGLIIYQ
ncbi:MAG TPA: hypothetical protein VN445_01170 [Rectinemataceae bacterium]|nr:hypothetical protein [Rectinemataceae bacterium]